MRCRATSCYLIAVAIFMACSSEDPSEDAGGAVSDAAATPDAGPPLADAMEPGEPDAAPLPDAAPTPDAAVEQCGRIRCDCTFNGITLFGRVQYVTSFPDITVRETAFPDLRVREGSFADECGEWEIVTSFPDFTVEIVTSFEDFGIEYSSFPGIP